MIDEALVYRASRKLLIGDRPVDLLVIRIKAGEAHLQRMWSASEHRPSIKTIVRSNIATLNTTLIFRPKVFFTPSIWRWRNRAAPRCSSMHCYYKYAAAHLCALSLCVNHSAPNNSQAAYRMRECQRRLGSSHKQGREFLAGHICLLSWQHQTSRSCTRLQRPSRERLFDSFAG